MDFGWGSEEFGKNVCYFNKFCWLNDREFIYSYMDYSGEKAEDAGLKVGDVIVKANGETLNENRDFERNIANGKVLLWVDRKGQKLFTVLMLK